MNKKVSIFAIILIIIGIIGSVWTGLDAVPKVINFAFEKRSELSKEHCIYEKNIEINEISVYTQLSNIEIRKHDKNTVKITKIGTDRSVNYDFKHMNNKLELKEEYDNSYDEFKIRNFEDLFNTTIENMFSNYRNQIIIYVPNDVDINVVTREGDLLISDDVLLNNVFYKTEVGNFTNNIDLKEGYILDKLQINSSNSISLGINEIIGIKNIDIESRDLNIHSNRNEIYINNPENYIPENINIINNNIDNSSEEEIWIDASIPLAKNVNIDALNSFVHLDMPIRKYKINFDIKSYENIDLECLFENRILDESSRPKYENIKDLKGILNEQNINLENQYNTIINAKNVSFK